MTLKRFFVIAVSLVIAGGHVAAQEGEPLDSQIESADQKTVTSCGTNPMNYFWSGLTTKKGWDMHQARNLSASPGTCRQYVSFNVEEWDYDSGSYKFIGRGTICMKDAVAKRLYAAETKKLSRLRDLSVAWSKC